MNVQKTVWNEAAPQLWRYPRNGSNGDSDVSRSLVTNVATVRVLRIPLLFAGVAAIAYALIFVTLSSKIPSPNEPRAG